MSDVCKNIFFFENGQVCKPMKITKKANDLEQVIWKRCDGQYGYEEKLLYTLDGDAVLAFRPCLLPQNTAYVLVVPCEDFIPNCYEEKFMELLTCKDPLEC